MSLQTGRLIRCAVLAGLVLVAYGNSLQIPFHFDDWHVIRENPAVHSLGNIPAFFADPAHFSILEGNRDYRPVFLVSVALAWWAGDGSPLPFHLISVVVHLINCLLLYAIVYRSLLAPRAMKQRFSSAACERAAFAGAALFAVHPLTTEAINYISSQSVPLAALFYLTSFGLFLHRYAPPARPSTAAQPLSAVASGLAYLLAVLCKPIAITLPVVLALWELLLGTPIAARAGASRREYWQTQLPRVWKHLPYLGISVGYLLLRNGLFQHAFGGAGTPARPYYTHYLTQTHAMAFYYLKATLYPSSLSVDREYPLTSSILEPGALAAVAVLALLAAGLFLARRSRAVLFFALWFPTCLLVTTYATVLGQTVNEHRAYLSLMGACAVAGIGLAWARCRLPLRFSDFSLGPRAGGQLLTATLIAIVLVFSVTTRARNRVWQSPLALWESAALNQGTYRAHMNYARELEAAERSEEALAEFELAVALGPYAYPYMNLGLAYIRRGQTQRGLDHLAIAARLWPQSPEMRFFYAYGLEKTERYTEAAAELRAALSYRPNYPQARNALARLELAAEDDLDAAVRRFEELRPKEPAEAQLFELAFRLQKADRREAAIAYYEELIARAPAHRQGLFNLGHAYLDSEDPEELARSIELMGKVLEIASDYSEAIFHMASAHWKLKQPERALPLDRRYLDVGGHTSLKARSAERIEAAERGELPAPQ